MKQYVLSLLLGTQCLFAPTYMDDWTQSFQLTKDPITEVSAYQMITIFENKTLGKVLMQDEIVQFSEKDEFIYHEMISHVPLMIHPNPKAVLIVGGGDGACAREVIKHPSVEQVTVVEIDALMVDLCKKHMPELAQNSFDDPRVRLLIDDGYNYLKKTSSKYDVIIVDCSDPLKSARSLYSEDFYKLCNNALNPGGIFCTQSGNPITQINLLQTAKSQLDAFFDKTQCYFTPFPSQIGGIKSFVIGFTDSSQDSLPCESYEGRFKALEPNVDYYSPTIHISSFICPKYLKGVLYKL